MEGSEEEALKVNIQMRDLGDLFVPNISGIGNIR